MFVSAGLYSHTSVFHFASSAIYVFGGYEYQIRKLNKYFQCFYLQACMVTPQCSTLLVVPSTCLETMSTRQENLMNISNVCISRQARKLNEYSQCFCLQVCTVTRQCSTLLVAPSTCLGATSTRQTKPSSRPRCMPWTLWRPSGASCLMKSEIR